ncbi:MAG: hypothetical protein PHR96_04200 [Clostridia bacterium]|nr:hypothetical protein [Clostridia bacterium]
MQVKTFFKYFEIVFAGGDWLFEKKPVQTRMCLPGFEPCSKPTPPAKFYKP